MSLILENVELFKFLTEFELDNTYCDLHNEFKCFQISYIKNDLNLYFKHNKKEITIKFTFQNTLFDEFEYIFENNIDLTLDLMYRGKCEVNDKLIETNENNQSYFYIEFVDNVIIKLWCDRIVIEKIEDIGKIEVEDIYHYKFIKSLKLKFKEILKLK